MSEYLLMPRLRLIPLRIDQLELVINQRHELGRILGIAMPDLELSAGDDFLNEYAMAIRQFTIPNVKKHMDDQLLFTHWLIVERNLDRAIGGIGAGGPPDQNGEVMIGYFIDQRFENKGYATEAVIAFSGWIATLPGVKCVIADTLTDGIASQKVLQKSGFTLRGEVQEGLRWELRR